MNLEDIRLSEIRKINTVYFHLYVESKKLMNKYNQTETDSWIQRTNQSLPEGGCDEKCNRGNGCTNYQI